MLLRLKLGSSMIKKKDSWEVIIILPGVRVIPEDTFHDCKNVKTIIMADTVRRIEREAFSSCKSLVFVRLSRNLEYIGFAAFYGCKSLTSIFIPPSCREIGNWAFIDCEKLIILSVPQHTELGDNVIDGSKLIHASHFDFDKLDSYFSTTDSEVQEEVHAWVCNINVNEEYALHRACSAYNPLFETIYQIVKRNGLQAFQVPNGIGITPSQYLEANPFVQDVQKKVVNRYILEMMGETV